MSPHAQETLRPMGLGVLNVQKLPPQKGFVSSPHQGQASEAFIHANITQALWSWCDASGSGTLKQALESDLAQLVKNVHPILRSRDVRFRLFSRGTPIFSRSPIHVLDSLSDYELPIESQNSRWGVLVIANGPSYIRFHSSLRDCRMELDFTLRFLADRFDQLAEKERMASGLRALGQATGSAVHEVRNPLTSLRLQLHLLGRLIEKSSKDEGASTHGDSNQLITDMESEMNRITGHLEDLAAASQFCAGRFTLQQHDVEIVSTLRSVVARYDRLFELRGTTCSFHPAVDAIHGQWDPFRIEQVVGNLLSNAWKYGARRPVDVFVELREDCCSGHSEGCCVIRVRDQGRGISEDALARIFEGFYRTDFAATEKGSGLGLYVCREITRAMGGSLEAKSKIGEGSEFIVCIPRFQKDKNE